MRTTPAAAARIRKMASLQSSSTSPTRSDLNIIQQMLAMMHDHKRTLKKIQSISAKGQQKALFLDDYRPYIDGVLSADTGEQDEIIVTIMMWSIDAECIDDALMIASYVMRHNLKMPDRFNRTTNVAIAEQMSELALKPESPVLPEHLTALYELIGKTDMPDQVRVKLEKACGLGLTESAPEVALQHLKNAIALSDRCGVKQQIKALEKQLESDDQQSEDEQNSDSADTPES
ncbi:phage terminase small subunit [Thalassolituus oleivorans]|uniref:phage terminase small subunit n=1 Tax=Thalassolituus oleivorans TaxID=187493 RepID=UPI0023F28560|nr:phage terminase small subunit [Thalassolituus oleivorans]